MEVVSAWQLWFVPTDLGKSGFRWKERPLGEPFCATRNDADLARYLEEVDDPAPDKRDYYRIELRAADVDPLS